VGVPASKRKKKGPLLVGGGYRRGKKKPSARQTGQGEGEREKLNWEKNSVMVAKTTGAKQGRVGAVNGQRGQWGSVSP